MSRTRKTQALTCTLLTAVMASICGGCGGSAPHITAVAVSRPRPGEARCTRIVANKLGRPDGPFVARDACHRRFNWYLAKVTNKASKAVWFHCTVEADNPDFGKLGVWTVPFNNQLDAPTELQGGKSVALTWFIPETLFATQVASYKLRCKPVSPP